jgi:hypothetical protein
MFHRAQRLQELPRSLVACCEAVKSATIPRDLAKPSPFLKRFRQCKNLDQLANLFPRRRAHDTATNLRSGRTQAFATWADVTGVAMAA